MIKRSLHKRFGQAVLSGVKTTTIRDNPWPVGVPIMLYNWSGKPYGSKHSDVCAVVVDRVERISIQKIEGGEMCYIVKDGVLHDLWKSEGFESQSDMDDWFSPMLPNWCANRPDGFNLLKHLMHFRRVA